MRNLDIIDTRDKLRVYSETGLLGSGSSGHPAAARRGRGLEGAVARSYPRRGAGASARRQSLLSSAPPFPSSESGVYAEIARRAASGRAPGSSGTRSRFLMTMNVMNAAVRVLRGQAIRHSPRSSRPLLNRSSSRRRRILPLRVEEPVQVTLIRPAGLPHPRTPDPAGFRLAGQRGQYRPFMLAGRGTAGVWRTRERRRHSSRAVILVLRVGVRERHLNGRELVPADPAHPHFVPGGPGVEAPPGGGLHDRIGSVKPFFPTPRNACPRPPHVAWPSPGRRKS